MVTKPDECLLSRFLAKVALEALAIKFLPVPGGLEAIIDKKELDRIRNYARRGSEDRCWPYHERRLYPIDFVFVNTGEEPYEILHEWTFLYTEALELYFVLAICGTEYAINMGGPETDGYKEWVSRNGGGSPLYPDKQ